MGEIERVRKSSTRVLESGRRDELAAAAYRLIAAKGVGGLSIRLLAREVGGTTGAVTHHFISRYGLQGRVTIGSPL